MAFAASLALIPKESRSIGSPKSGWMDGGEPGQSGSPRGSAKFWGGRRIVEFVASRDALPNAYEVRFLADNKTVPVAVSVGSVLVTVQPLLE